MTRLHKRSSRSYPGRPAHLAAKVSAAPCVVTCREFGQESAEAILGVGSHPKGVREAGNEPGEQKSLEVTPPKGQTHRGK